MRRKFLKDALLLSAGGIFLPSALLSACKKKSLFDGVSYSGKVIVIGAGAAGLYAAYLLKSKGVDCTILEASGVHGGRMGKVTGFADYDIDTGAQWLHGLNNIVGSLVQEKKIANTLDESGQKFWFMNDIVDTLPKDPFIFDTDNLPDITFKDYAHQRGLETEYDNIIEAIAGDQGAAASSISAYWNHKEEENWVSGDDDFKFAGTYYDVINDHIAGKVATSIVYNEAVTQIDHAGDKVLITTGSNTTYQADKVIVTVPISILKLNEIAFVPVLPEEKMRAFDKIGMGPGMKVFLKFSNKFYSGNLYGGAVCAAYADDTVGKTTADNVLLAFVMGEQAARLHAAGSHAAITAALLAELDEMYSGQATRYFKASSVHDYTNRPYIKGAYSYSMPNMGNARHIAALPVNKKLFFAGEAMNINGNHQTVHGAIESGYKAVLDIFETL